MIISFYLQFIYFVFRKYKFQSKMENNSLAYPIDSNDSDTQIIMTYPPINLHHQPVEDLQKKLEQEFQ